MWLDSVRNNAEIKKCYKKRDPLLKDLIFNLSIDCLTGNVLLNIEFYDWPKPLPKDWFVNALSGIELHLTLEEVRFNHVDLNCKYEKSDMVIELNDDGTFHIRIDYAGHCLYDLEAKRAEVKKFGFWNHSWD